MLGGVARPGVRGLPAARSVAIEIGSPPDGGRVFRPGVRGLPAARPVAIEIGSLPMEAGS